MVRLKNFKKGLERVVNQTYPHHPRTRMTNKNIASRASRTGSTPHSVWCPDNQKVAKVRTSQLLRTRFEEEEETFA